MRTRCGAVNAVRINDAAGQYKACPFELSGGMCQRVVIAIALARDPQRLIADEPNTGREITTRKAGMGFADELAAMTGLPVHLLDRFPHQLPGGQKTRVGIASAIAPEPELLIMDEPTAALDASIRAAMLNLLVDLRARLDMAYLFASHDLDVIRLLCDRVVVMKAARSSKPAWPRR